MKIGIIGCGNMGSAIINGIINTNFIKANEVYVCDKNIDKVLELKNELGINVINNPIDLAKQIDILILAVKPNASKKILEEIEVALNKNQIFVSIMAGITINTIEKYIGEDKKIIRIMPNTPALVQEGMSAISVNKNVLKEDSNIVLELFNKLGKAEIVEEKLMDIVTGISGSSPAYVFMMIEAMADAAVKGGMPRDKAYIFVSQAILGSAKMVLDTKLHPGVLKDMVTSPGGTTIEAVESLEKTGFRNSLIKAVNKATDRSKELGKNK